nr:hypothetical protein [Propionibacterium sp.]
MRGRADVTGLIAGLLFCVLAGVALWAAFGTVDWTGIGLALPFALVAIGLLGLNLTRSS